MDNLKNALPYIRSAVVWLGKVISAVGILTLAQFALYFIHPYEYENIIVKNVDDISTKKINNQYDIVDDLDFDKNDRYKNHKKIVISPQESLMESIEFSKLNGDMDGYNKTNTQPQFDKLEPQQYLLIRVPTADLNGVIKMNFNINYKKGEYIFSPNMRNGHEDKIVLKVRKTFASFLNK